MESDLSAKDSNLNSYLGPDLMVSTTSLAGSGITGIEGNEADTVSLFHSFAAKLQKYSVEWKFSAVQLIFVI